MNRSLQFPLMTDNPRLGWLLKEFRLIVNKSIRIANAGDIRSLGRLCRVAYADFSQDHEVLKQYISSAFQVALSLLKAHRRRLKKGRSSSLPYVRRPILKAGNQSFLLDRVTGRLRVPIRAREYFECTLPLGDWHRTFLNDSEWRIGSLTIVPDKVIVAMTRLAARPYAPRAAIALDTNEDSLDGVFVMGNHSKLITVPFQGVRRIQAVHFRRRRSLARKKHYDQRLARQLLRQEGLRERNRVGQRFHRVSKMLVRVARQCQAAIIVESLTLVGAGGRSRALNRRLSSWPRGEIHRQIEYKAALEGVPIIRVNPRNTSKTCPACGAVRRGRAGKVFMCACGWRMDRQLNAGLNILRTAVASNEALARAVRFQPGALRDDVVIPLCDLLREGVGAREEPSGVELGVV